MVDQKARRYFFLYFGSPYWIRHCEFENFEFVFEISDPKSSRMPNFTPLYCGPPALSLSGNNLPIIMRVSSQQILNIPVTFIRVPYLLSFFSLWKLSFLTVLPRLNFANRAGRPDNPVLGYTSGPSSGINISCTLHLTFSCSQLSVYL